MPKPSPEKLAAALRANLKRRKAATPAGPVPSAPKDPPDSRENPPAPAAEPVRPRF